MTFSSFYQRHGNFLKNLQFKRCSKDFNALPNLERVDEHPIFSCWLQICDWLSRSKFVQTEKNWEPRREKKAREKQLFYSSCGKPVTVWSFSIEFSSKPRNFSHVEVKVCWNIRREVPRLQIQERWYQPAVHVDSTLLGLKANQFCNKNSQWRYGMTKRKGMLAFS